MGDRGDSNGAEGEIIANGDGDVEALALFVDADAVDAKGEVRGLPARQGVGEPELGWAAAGSDFVDGALEGVGDVEVASCSRRQDSSGRAGLGGRWRRRTGCWRRRASF